MLPKCDSLYPCSMQDHSCAWEHNCEHQKERKMKPVRLRVRLEIIYDNDKRICMERHESWEELSRIKGMGVFDALKEIARIAIDHLKDVYEEEC